MTKILVGSSPVCINSFNKKIVTFLFLILCFSSSNAQRLMDKLNRGVVVTRTADNTAFINWRLAGRDVAGIGFNVYRRTNGTVVKLNTTPLTGGTNLEDKTANLSVANEYFVNSVVNGVEKTPSLPYTLAANTAIEPFYRVPIEYTPGYGAKFIWVGDLDGDGEYDFVFDKQPEDESKPILLEAYTRFGRLLWRYDCGINSVNKYNISPGSSTLDIGHGDNFTVYDMNSDGYAEVIVRTANGVKFGDGKTLTFSDNNRQFISVLNGMTGAEMARANVPTDFIAQGPMNGHMGIAYLDGVNPSVVWEAKNRNADKSFNEMVVTYTLTNGALVQNWKWLRPGSQGDAYPDGHQIRIIDLDGDGKDEIVPFGHALRSNGTSLWSLNPQDIWHGDRFHIGDMDPAHPGVEGYCIQQGYSVSGIMWAYYDGKTGKILQKQIENPNTHRDMARGCAGDFDPRYPGYEFWTFSDGVYNVSGARTSTTIPDSYPNLRMWWDGDLLSEMLDNMKFTKWDYASQTEGRLYTARNVFNVGPKTPGLMADIIGDWREEAVYEAVDHKSLVVYTTPYTTPHRIYTLSHNPAYRACMTVKGYYQGNMLDYFLGDKMATPPPPNIVYVRKAAVPPAVARITSNMEEKSTVSSDVVYPSLSAGNFNLRLRDKTRVKVYNAAGGLVQDLGTVNGTQFGSKYVAGVYMVHVSTNEGTTVYKIVKQ